MVMLVETFEQEELKENPVEQTAEQIELIELLGLNGQKKLVSSDKKTLSPYPEVTDEQSFIIGSICPERYKVEEYSRTQIPLRVLRIIQWNNTMGVYKDIRIFDKRSSEIKDPFLVGFSENYYSGKAFLLARWGEELLPWRELKKLADEAILAKKQQYVKKIRSEIEFFANGGQDQLSLPSFSAPSVFGHVFLW